MKEFEYTYKVSAAGRINIIGEHIDYCGGKVFPAALSLKNTVYVRPNGTNKINIEWTTLPERLSLDIDKLESYKTLPHGNYQAGCAHIWKSMGHKVMGCDMLQDCSIPFGSGLSSSAAIEVSTIAALAKIAGEQIDKVEIALAAQRAEREYAGVNCGIMDQYASACGKAGNAMLLDCKTLDCEYVPLNTGRYAIILIDSKKPHNLIVSKYNERRAETDEALKILAPITKISCLAELSINDFERCAKMLPGKIRYRVRHVLEECARVGRAQAAMKRGNIKLLGELLNESHSSLRYLYEVTGRELDVLAEAAQSHPACIGSRMMGGGFGGSTISLVEKGSIDDFKEFVTKKYERLTGFHPECYNAEISDGIEITENK